VTDNSGALIKATSGEPEIEAALLLSSHLREDPKTPGCVNALTEPNPPQPSLLIGLLLLTWLDLSIIVLDEPSAKTTRDQPPVAGPPSAITPPLSQQPQGQGDSGSG